MENVMMIGPWAFVGISLLIFIGGFVAGGICWIWKAQKIMEKAAVMVHLGDAEMAEDLLLAAARNPPGNWNELGGR